MHLSVTPSNAQWRTAVPRTRQPMPCLGPQRRSVRAQSASHAAERRSAFNFAPASPRDSVVYGCSMPGFSDPLPPAGSVGPADVAQWATFMRQRGVTDVVVLLGDDELASMFAAPGLAEMYKVKGFTPHLLRARAQGAYGKIMAVFDACEAAGDRRVVTHCTGGCHRVGCVLTGWLAHRYGLSYPEAVKEMASQAAAAGVMREAPSESRFEQFVSGKGW